jgi:plastocyanin
MRWLVAVVLATLALAPSAYGATVQGLENPNRWSPEPVEITPGESVTWTWTSPHNVRSTSTNWTAQGDVTGFTQPFPAAGTYTYVCGFHPEMTGTVKVSDPGGPPPPPPPPPPPSEQPFANDQPPPTVFETVDAVRPELTRVHVDAVRNGARVRFRLSERAQVIVRFRRGGIVVKSKRRAFGKGRGRITVHDRRMHGRYKIEVVARDLSGNRSAVERERLTIP